MIYGVRGVLLWWRASQNWLGYPKLPWNWPWSFDPLTSIAFRSLLFLGLGRLWIESSSDSKPLLRAKTSHLMWFVDPNFLLEGKTTKVALWVTPPQTHMSDMSPIHLDFSVGQSALLKSIQVYWIPRLLSALEAQEAPVTHLSQWTCWSGWHK
jgi:hypothetical protein